MSTSLPLAITQGDPAGIGPEIVAKAFRDAPRDMRGCFVVGDLATLRRVLVAGAGMDLADRRTTLQAIAAPGRPYRTLAEEQLAYLLIEEGQTDAAITALQALMQDQEASGALKARAGQVVIALGGVPPEASSG